MTLCQPRAPSGAGGVGCSGWSSPLPSVARTCKAWAPDRGIAKVEVAIDGVWQEARLSTPISDATWVQWVVDWPATAGAHTLQVRATDGSGQVQPEGPTPPAPDGARGWHSVNVQVG